MTAAIEPFRFDISREDGGWYVKVWNQNGGSYDTTEKPDNDPRRGPFDSVEAAQECCQGHLNVCLSTPGSLNWNG